MSVRRHSTAVTLCYSTGEEARVGDRVEYQGEPSVVEAIIDREEAFRAHGVDGFAVFLKNVSFGLLFEPLDGYVLHHRIAFIGRSA
jgi:hypothetical protein